MENNSNSLLPKLLKLSLDLLIVVGAAVFAWQAAGSVINLKDSLSIGIVVTFILYITGSLSLIGIMISLRIVIASLIKKTPFIWDNVKGLKRISMFCFIISLCYAMNIVINNQFMDLRIVTLDRNGIHTDIEFFIFFFAGCFILVLSQVFKQAVEFKEENDLTI